jgi:hypothetical protein
MKRSLALAVAVVFVILETFVGVGPAGAQEQIDFTIGKFTCPTDPGNVSLAAGNIPDECDPSAGVSFTVALTDGTEIGSCTTDDSGICKVQVPNEAMVTATEDVSTAPAGSTPRENPITTQAVTEFAGALFINLPVTQPPDVGIGTTAEQAGSDSNLALSILVSFVLALIAFLWRRQTVKSH